MNLLPAVQVRVVPPAVPGTARPLPPLRPITLTSLTTSLTATLSLLTGLLRPTGATLSS